MPNNMTINYLLDSDQSLLGTEIYQNITEITLPLLHETGHKITLTRFFEGHTSHRWLIERINHQTPEQTNLFLTPRIECENEIFLAKTYSSKRTVASRITKGTLVEVEYGFIQSTKRITGKISSVKRYPDFVQNGEMHKRRLAIVINACFPSTLQVIPITSIHQNENDKNIFEISLKSLDKLVHYNSKDIRSFALGHMIQTVSIRRILPPLAIQKDKRCYRDIGYSQRLEKEDMKSLELALTTAIGYGDYQNIRTERNRLRLDVQELTKQNTQLINELSINQNNQVAYEQSSIRCHALEEKMIDWYCSMDSNLSQEDARKKLEQELTLYLEVYGG
ncbi:hypothetical protein [Proteus hauseri]|uniref:hypothetical protein n=1 Tax=Proteus hauseri TaxID=183417 RepID=UPI0032DBD029